MEEPVKEIFESCMNEDPEEISKLLKQVGVDLDEANIDIKDKKVKEAVCYMVASLSSSSNAEKSAARILLRVPW